MGRKSPASHLPTGAQLRKKSQAAYGKGGTVSAVCVSSGISCPHDSECKVIRLRHLKLIDVWMTLLMYVCETAVSWSVKNGCYCTEAQNGSFSILESDFEFN